MTLKTFFLTESSSHRVSLRRLGAEGQVCPKTPYGCRASVVVFEGEVPDPHTTKVDPTPEHPTQCAECGQSLTGNCYRDVQKLYEGCPDGKRYTLHDAPPGAMWDAHWMSEFFKGPDGKCLVVKCPNGREWMIDGPASNCTMPEDRVHRCWTRGGSPEAGTVDVGKHYGPTCTAGGGSIQAGDYHGFLRYGEFIT